jgi:nitrite reductase/ring-hydroxylating ferredoxin subunit
VTTEERIRVEVGPLESIPTDRCESIGDGRAVVARVDGEVVAFQNRCLHQAAELAGGLVKDGVLTCPLHFWRYRLPEGGKIGEENHTLPRYPVEIIDGVVFVELPAQTAQESMREFLLRHARTSGIPEEGP